MKRYSIITQKNPREMVLLRGRGCFYEKCSFCDYYIDKSDNEEDNFALNSRVLEGALTDIQNADMLIIGGTSLAVYPAAGLVNYYRGKRLVLINKSPTPYDSKADLVISGAIGEVLGQIKV